MLDYSDNVTIKITKVKDEFGKFTHWEADVSFSNNSFEMGGTSPDYFGVVDMALDHIRDVAQYWTIDDANKY